MTVRPPQSFTPSLRSGISALEYEIAEERANALGRHGRHVEDSLAKLRQWDADSNRQNASERENLVQDAAEAVWAYFIQREMFGLSNNQDAIQSYGIPGDVLAKVGTFKT